MKKRIQVSMALVLFGSTTALPMGCPVWRTEHKVETTHKIDAHIVIDVRKVEAEAQQVESEVRGTPKAVPDGQQSSAVDEGPVILFRPASKFWSIFNLTSTASAQQAPTNGDEQAAIERRKNRAPAIERALSEGCLGENSKGFVEPRPCDASDEQKADLKRLAGEENKDRRIIYSRTVVKQGHNLSEDGITAVGLIYAKVIRDKLRSGQLFQVPQNDERFQEFKQSDLGRKLPAARKGEWVRVP